ncbi:MAG: hypothetical protein IPP90_10570 [Gemmatimonadaceae bacterium]|nr:hypothetical protein [Gemmatimonadaceae bacterium]
MTAARGLGAFAGAETSVPPLHDRANRPADAINSLCPVIAENRLDIGMESVQRGAAKR